MTPVEFECAACGDDPDGCEHCEQGTVPMTGCPLEFAGEDVWEAIEMAGLYEKGVPPVAGGALDQAAKFIDAARFIWAEQARWRAQLGLI